MKFVLDHAGTHYVLWRIDVAGGFIWACETGWGSNYGQWVLLGQPDVAWTYLTEKVPGLREGDKEGWIMLFSKAGLEVFG